MVNLKVIVAALVLVFTRIDANEIRLKKLSCNFRDTINITNGALDQEGRFHHDGLIYEKGMFAEFNFIYLNYSHEISVDPHIRGCVCELKKCIRVCRFCNENDALANFTCVKTKKLAVHVDGDADEIKQIPLTGKNLEYAVLEGRRCQRMYQLEPMSYDSDKWNFKDVSINSNPDFFKFLSRFFQYGEIEIVEEMLSVTHHEFCFVQNETDDGTYKTEVLRCVDEVALQETEIKSWITRIGKHKMYSGFNCMLRFSLNLMNI
jgi:Methuselah N-terminus